jgi:tetraacyldisaccharide 4'-kinase
MREPAFWRRPGSAAERLLSPLAALYGAVAAGRMAGSGYDAGIPVLCIGNLTLGGAGKTPTAIAVANLLKEAGEKPAILSRGYGGSQRGPVWVDASIHRASDVGDEPLLLAGAAPTVVSRDRAAGARSAAGKGASVIVMDDGFQNPSLRKDASLLVVDAATGIGNGSVFPAGPLRAPLARQLERAQALLVIGQGAAADPVTTAAGPLPVFHGRLAPDERAVARLRGQPVLAFAGIGSPDKFFATLRAEGIDVREQRAFPDHHRYTGADAGDLLRRARRDGLMLVTTEKDMVRMHGADQVRALADTACTLPVTLAVTEAEMFRAFVLMWTSAKAA